MLQRSIALRQEMIERRLNMNQDIIYVIESKHDFREPLLSFGVILKRVRKW